MKHTDTPSCEVDLAVLVFTTNGNGKPVTETAKVVDVSASGARLSWVNNLKEPGQMLRIEYRGKRAEFRVAWIGKPGTKYQGQVGVESLQADVDIWGLPPVECARPESVLTLPAMEPATVSVAVVSSWSGSDRRRTKRLSCRGGAEFQEVGSQLRNAAIVSDVCVGGCYIETRTTLSAETRLEFVLRINDSEIAGTGEVRICHPGMGMGIAFREMTPENRVRLEDLIESLVTGTSPIRTPAPPAGGEAKEGTNLELLLFMVDTLKEKGLLTPEEYGNVLSRARKKTTPVSAGG